MAEIASIERIDSFFNTRLCACKAASGYALCGWGLRQRTVRSILAIRAPKAVT